MSRESEKLPTALRRSEWNSSSRCECSDIWLIKFHEDSSTKNWRENYGGYAAAGESFVAETARERESFSDAPGNKREKEREREESSRKNFPEVSRFLSFFFSLVQWQNWILVKAPSRSTDRHRHFRVGRPAHNPDSFPSFLSASLNYISLRTFVIAMARYSGNCVCSVKNVNCLSRRLTQNIGLCICKRSLEAILLRNKKICCIYVHFACVDKHTISTLTIDFLLAIFLYVNMFPS